MGPKGLGSSHACRRGPEARRPRRRGGGGRGPPGSEAARRYAPRVAAEHFQGYEQARAGRGLLRDGFVRRAQEVVAALREEFPAGRFRLLDVGTADGRMLEAIARAFPGAEAVGLEALEDLAASARARGLDVRVGRAEALPFPDGAFDAVTLISTLKHVPDAGAALREGRRVRLSFS